MNNRFYLFIIFIAVIFFSCVKKSDFIKSEPVSSYYPLQVGKYILYRVDSLKFIQFGQKDTIVSYFAKDVVDASFTDGQGRPVYRVIRYQRTINSIESDFRPSLTYFINPTPVSIELVENNLRFLKLKHPVRDGYSWKGNSYLPSSPYESYFPFSNDEDMPFWDYTYQDIDQTITVNNIVYDSTITVHQVADSVNVPISQPDGLAYRNYWVETYAKNIGLIYKEVVMWEYQPPNGGLPGYRAGFGITLSILDHN